MVGVLLDSYSGLSPNYQLSATLQIYSRFLLGLHCLSPLFMFFSHPLWILMPSVLNNKHKSDGRGYLMNSISYLCICTFFFLNLCQLLLSKGRNLNFIVFIFTCNNDLLLRIIYVLIILFLNVFSSALLGIFLTELWHCFYVYISGFFKKILQLSKFLISELFNFVYIFYSHQCLPGIVQGQIPIFLLITAYYLASPQIYQYCT